MGEGMKLWRKFLQVYSALWIDYCNPVLRVNLSMALSVRFSASTSAACWSSQDLTAKFQQAPSMLVVGFFASMFARKLRFKHFSEGGGAWVSPLWSNCYEFGQI